MAGFTATVLAATALAGAGMTAYGQYMQGQQSAKAEQMNKQMYEQQAEQVDRARGLENQKINRMKKAAMSRSMAVIGAKGLAPSGSPMEVMLDTATQIELDRQTMNYNADIQRSRALNAATMPGQYAKNYQTMGMLGASSTLLTEGNRMFMRNWSTSSTSSPSANVKNITKNRLLP